MNPNNPPTSQDGLLTMFTPGPWRVDYAGGYGKVGFYAGAVLLGTAHQVGEGDDRIDVAEANARLIAAAPELFEALEHIVYGTLSLPRFAEEQARAAIAKVRASQ